MPTFFQDEINVDIIQHTPRIAPVLGRANSPTNGAIWYDSASNAFQGVVNGVVAAIGGAGAPAFSAITPGTNTGALVIGTGGSLTTSGTGTISATPGGTNTQVQYNNNGVFGGISGFTWNGTSLAFVAANPLALSSNGGSGGITITNGASGRVVFSVDANLNNNISTGDAVNNTGGVTINSLSGREFTPSPTGAALSEILFGDSVTHTWSHNSNNNGLMSFSGAWVNTNVTPVTVNAAVATPQNLMSASIPAGTLNRVGRSLRIWLSGVYSLAAVASTTTIAVKLGALTLVSIIDTSVATGVTNGQFNLLAYATVQTSGASGALEPHGNLTIELGATGAVADSVFADSNTATVGTVDLTANQTLQVTVTFSNASASNSATQRQMVLETIG